VTPGFAFEATFRQETQGIGADLYDFGFLIPGSDNLLSLVEMGDLARFPDNPNEIFLGDTGSTMVVLGHEFGHLWLAFASFLDAAGNVSAAHRLGAHWSFYMDAEGSLMHGNDWIDNGDGTFSATDGAHRRYSPLDRYLMGPSRTAAIRSRFPSSTSRSAAGASTSRWTTSSPPRVPGVRRTRRRPRASAPPSWSWAWSARASPRRRSIKSTATAGGGRAISRKPRISAAR